MNGKSNRDVEYKDVDREDFLPNIQSKPTSLRPFLLVLPLQTLVKIPRKFVHYRLQGIITDSLPWSFPWVYILGISPEKGMHGLFFCLCMTFCTTP